MKTVVRRWLWGGFLVLLAGCAVLLTGCELSSDSPDPLFFGDNDPNVVVAMGDSVTAGSAITGPAFPQLVAEMSGKIVINEGIGGARSSWGADLIGGILEREKPGYVFILYGINDVIHVNNNDWTIENLRYMIRIARERNTIPIVGTIPPRRGSRGTDRHAGLNERIRQLAKEERVRLADVERAFNGDYGLLLPDGFHPNEDGNRIIAEVFFEALF